MKQAIQLARQRDAHLTFLFIVDTEFLSFATVAPATVIHEQLHNMGDFIMAKLEDQARESGVTAVDHAILEGGVREQIYRFVLDHDVDTVVMGRPVNETGGDVFDAGTVLNFAAALEHETGVEVVVAEQEDT